MAKKKPQEEKGTADLRRRNTQTPSGSARIQTSKRDLSRANAAQRTQHRRKHPLTLIIHERTMRRRQQQRQSRLKTTRRRRPLSSLTTNNNTQNRLGQSRRSATSAAPQTIASPLRSQRSAQQRITRWTTRRRRRAEMRGSPRPRSSREGLPHGRAARIAFGRTRESGAESGERSAKDYRSKTGEVCGVWRWYCFGLVCMYHPAFFAVELDFLFLPASLLTRTARVTLLDQTSKPGA